jgi:hypothetical protein
MAAAAAVFATVELLESILIHLSDHQDSEGGFESAAFVNKSWFKVMETSPTLQHRLIEQAFIPYDYNWENRTPLPEDLIRKLSTADRAAKYDHEWHLRIMSEVEKDILVIHRFEKTELICVRTRAGFRIVDGVKLKLSFQHDSVHHKQTVPKQDPNKPKAIELPPDIEVNWSIAVHGCEEDPFWAGPFCVQGLLDFPRRSTLARVRGMWRTFDSDHPMLFEYLLMFQEHENDQQRRDLIRKYNHPLGAKGREEIVKRPGYFRDGRMTIRKY